jgi:transposase
VILSRPSSPVTNQQVQSLSEQVQSLTERLKKPNPRYSSLPPSSEHPHGKPPRKPSKRRIRKQGGQEGHRRHLRELIPIEQCEAVISCVPESCRRCGGLVRPDESQPIRHQVWEIPPIEPTVNGYVRFTLVERVDEAKKLVVEQDARFDA